MKFKILIAAILSVWTSIHAVDPVILKEWKMAEKWRKRMAREEQRRRDEVWGEAIEQARVVDPRWRAIPLTLRPGGMEAIEEQARISAAIRMREQEEAGLHMVPLILRPLQPQQIQQPPAAVEEEEPVFQPRQARRRLFD